MKKLTVVLAVLAVLVAALFLTGPFFILNEGEQATVTRLGKIVAVHREAGLKFKSPFVDNVVKYPNKLLPWDGEPQRIPTKENQFIWVDATARWRISEPVKFYESVGTMESAYGRLDDVIDSAVRRVISSNFLREAVRNSNLVAEESTRESFQTGDAEGSAILDQLTRTGVVFGELEKCRLALAGEMLQIVNKIVPEFGIEILDIVPRQIRYSDELTQSVYARMIKERNQIAQAFRSYGEGKKAEWFGKLENEKRSILSQAYEAAETNKGKADAEATRIFAESYGRDPDFFKFWKAIESYRQTMPNFRKTLSTDLDYFRYLYSPTGR